MSCHPVSAQGLLSIVQEGWSSLAWSGEMAQSGSTSDWPHLHSLHLLLPRPEPLVLTSRSHQAPLVWPSPQPLLVQIIPTSILQTAQSGLGQSRPVLLSSLCSHRCNHWRSAHSHHVWGPWYQQPPQVWVILKWRGGLGTSVRSGHAPECDRSSKT